MEQLYSIVKTFLGELQYHFPVPLESLFTNDKSSLEQNSDIDVKVWSANSPKHYVVDIHIDITEGFEGRMDFHMHLVYSAIIKVSEKCKREEDDIVEMLGEEVPKKVFPIVRELVKALTSSTGLPPVELAEIDFEALLVKQIKKDDPEPALGYDWLLWDIRSTREGASFLETIDGVYGDTLLTYEDLPMYKYFYRFLKPIPYRHPDFEECESGFWDILFQLVFAESEEVKIIDVQDGLPEIEFSFVQYRSFNLADLTLKEIKDITSALACQAFTNTMVSLYRMPIDDNYARTLSSEVPPLDFELSQLYTPSPDMNDDDIEFIDHVRTKIRNYDDLTFDYRLLN